MLSDIESDQPVDDGVSEQPGLFPTRVYEQTPYSYFERRPDTKKQCTMGCLDLHRDFRLQRTRETHHNVEERRLAKELAREERDRQMRVMDAEHRVTVLVSRARQNLERTLNLHGGLMRSVQRDLDDATDIVHESRRRDAADEHRHVAAEPGDARTRWTVSPDTEQSLWRARAESDVHNWSNIDRLRRVVYALGDRERAYRAVLAQAGVPAPYDTEGIDEAFEFDPTLQALLDYRTAEGDRGRVVSRHSGQ